VGVGEAENAEKVLFRLLVVFSERGDGRLVILERQSRRCRSIVAKGEVEGTADGEIGVVQVVFRVKDDLAFDGAKVLGGERGAAVLHVAVDAGESIDETSDGFEEGGASRARSSLKG
jgi:hypothetical protein